MTLYMVVTARGKEIVPDLAMFFSGPTEDIVREGLHQRLFNGEGVLEESLETYGLELVVADDELQARLRAYTGDKKNEGPLPSGGCHR